MCSTIVFFQSKYLLGTTIVVVAMGRDISHSVPDQLGGHEHVKVLPFAKQLPPFLHGFGEQLPIQEQVKSNNSFIHLSF